MRLFKIILYLFCPFILNGQNLIPNASFEDTVAVKTTPLYALKHWQSVGMEGWNFMTPFNNSSQQHMLYSAPQNFAGNQNARTGDAYILLMVYELYTSVRSSRREYLQVKLNRALEYDSTYCMQMYISLADSYHFASRGQLGVYFSNNSFSVNHISNIPYIPQVIVSPTNYINDKVNWVEFNMQYTASGGEEYITIGNFNDTMSLDTQFVAGGGNEVWMQGSYYYIDDVWLSHCDSLPLGVGINEHSLKGQLEVYPNPFQEQFTISSKSKKKLSFQLYDALGAVIPIIVTARHEAVYNIQVGDIPKGIYLLQVNDGVEQASMKLLKQ